MSNTTKTTKETRYMIKCKKCKRKGMVDGTKTIVRYNYYQTIKTNVTWNIDRENHKCPNCDTSKHLEIKELIGHIVVNCACGPKCFNAIGPSCDCSCGGKNHGSGKPWHIDTVLALVS